MKYDINFSEYEIIILDLDGTITKKDTLLDFSIFFFQNNYVKFFFFFTLIILLKFKLINNKKFKNLYAQILLKNLTVEYINKKVEKWFNKRGKFLIRNFFKSIELKEHSNKIIVSSNFDFIVAKFANFINTQNYIATKLYSENGLYSGKLAGDVPYGKKKFELLLKKYNEHSLKNNSLAFGNDEADFEILKRVKKGILVEKNLE